jgi:excisionase family DNA binding protein
MQDTGCGSGQAPHAARRNPGWGADRGGGPTLGASGNVLRTITPSCAAVAPYLGYERPNRSPAVMSSPTLHGSANPRATNPVARELVDVPALAQALAALDSDQLSPLADALEQSRTCRTIGVADSPWLSVSEAAKRAGVTPETVHNWLSSRRLNRYGVPRRPLVDREELDAILRPLPTVVPRRQVRRSAHRPVSFSAQARAA